jgi:protein involved in polysaccharide export with SLBB domain
VQAAGKTIQQLRSDIESRLSAFIAEPQVDVAVLRFASQKVVVSGAVAKAGPQPISTNPLSVVEALGTAGIDTNNADLSGLLLTRNGRVYPLNLDSLNQQDSELQHVFLKGGDQLYLPYNDNKRIYVMGEVNQPRALSFKTATMNLSDVLGSVGGLSQTTSNGNAVYVIRGWKTSMSSRRKSINWKLSRRPQWHSLRTLKCVRRMWCTSARPTSRAGTASSANWCRRHRLSGPGLPLRRTGANSVTTANKADRENLESGRLPDGGLDVVWL